MSENRVLILLFDSFGIGATGDAERFGDEGADTLGHIVDHCAQGAADNRDRQGPLKLPNLAMRGLQRASEASRGHDLVHSLGYDGEPHGLYGYAAELSSGKDTPSGHWEIAGVPVLFDWTYFPVVTSGSCFPDTLITELIEKGELSDGILDAGHASGTEVIQRLGDEHCRTGKPIVYTSADSVLQIACHEHHFGLNRLLRLCELAREILDQQGLNVGRVIARPFVGESGNYTRTGNRRDYAVIPPEPTLLDRLDQAGGKVISIGKIADIYAHQGITEKHKATGLSALFDKTLGCFRSAESGSLIFTNFVDLDSSFGHRRDVSGYAGALEYLDGRLPELDALLRPGDMVVVTADHGCDPTWPGTDHTREHIPVLVWGPGLSEGFVGERKSFADIGQTIAHFMGLSPLNYGEAFLEGY